MSEKIKIEETAQMKDTANKILYNTYKIFKMNKPDFLTLQENEIKEIAFYCKQNKIM